MSKEDTEKFVAAMQRLGGIFQGTVGPNTMLFYPAGWMTCERTMTACASGVRKSVIGDGDIDVLRVLELSRPAPSLLMDAIFKMIEVNDATLADESKAAAEATPEAAAAQDESKAAEEATPEAGAARASTDPRRLAAAA